MVHECNTSQVCNDGLSKNIVRWWIIEDVRIQGLGVNACACHDIESPQESKHRIPVNR